jgi:hypothetical protein
LALWQGLVRLEGDNWPTNRKSLMAPELQNERTTTSLNDPSTPQCTASCTCRQEQRCPNRSGHRVQECVGDPPSVGDQELRHRVSLRTAEQLEHKQPKHVCLQELGDCLELRVTC